MTKIQVHIIGGGRFDPKRATTWQGRKNGETLYFTAGRRWVLQRLNSPRYVTPEAARNWLTRNGHKVPQRLNVATPFDAQMFLNCKREQLVRWHAARRVSGLSLSEWVRRALDLRANKQLK